MRLLMVLQPASRRAAPSAAKTGKYFVFIPDPTRRGIFRLREKDHFCGRAMERFFERRCLTAVCRLGAYSSACRRRRALETTEIELRLIATLAIIGFSSQPVNGYSAPA